LLCNGNFSKRGGRLAPPGNALVRPVITIGDIGLRDRSRDHRLFKKPSGDKAPVSGCSPVSTFVLVLFGFSVSVERLVGSWLDRSRCLERGFAPTARNFHFGWGLTAEVEIMGCGLSCRTLGDGFLGVTVPLSPFEGAAAKSDESGATEAPAAADFGVEWPGKRGCPVATPFPIVRRRAAVTRTVVVPRPERIEYLFIVIIRTVNPLSRINILAQGNDMVRSIQSQSCLPVTPPDIFSDVAHLEPRRDLEIERRRTVAGNRAADRLRADGEPQIKSHTAAVPRQLRLQAHAGTGHAGGALLAG